jgi:WD40 repeat protein
MGRRVLSLIGWFSAMGLVITLGGCHSSLGGGARPVGGGPAHQDGGPSHPDGASPTGSPVDGGTMDARPGAPLGDAGSATGSGRRDGSAGNPDLGRPMQTICPGDGPSLAPAAQAFPRVPTRLPMTCNPLTRTLVLTAPPAGAPGLFHRCAAFSASATRALALAPDGRLAAMVNGDGVARIIDVASQQVAALVAPPRARVTRVAFSPDGNSLVTVAGAEHEVTLTAVGSGTPIWTVTLPGALYGYTDGFAGAAAFSPDGTAIAVSPGTDLYLLDAATGAIQASYPSAALLDVAYAWNGQRIVAADAILTGSCVRSPDGGAVVVLDPHTLAKLVTVAAWEGYSNDNVTPAFRASPVDDLVLVPPSSRDKDQRTEAFKISDGSALPRTDLTTRWSAFLPDGDLINASDGAVSVRRAADGALVTDVAAPTPTSPVIAVSGNGGTVAIGGDGADLLRVWNLAQSYALGVCAFDDAAPSRVALSGDGRVAALAIGKGVTVVRPEDGAVLSRVTGDGEQVYQLSLSRTGQYVAMHFVDSEDTIVVNATNDGLVADLAKLPGGKGYLEGYVFSPDETTLAATFLSMGAETAVLDLVDLPSGNVSSRPVPIHTYPIGFSRGCPVLVDPATGPYRSCAGCDETGVPGIYPTIVSADGSFCLSNDGYTARTATLRALPGGKIVRTFGPRDEIEVAEMPDAVGPGGHEVLLGGSLQASCYDGPSFATELLDVTSGAVLDLLPPAVSSDEAITRVLSGGEIWCRP